VYQPQSVNRPIIALLISLAAGCARRPAASGAEPDSSPGAGPDYRNAEVTILIRNHNLLDMTIYLIQNGHPERLGTAPGLSSKIFSLRWRRVDGKGEIGLGADPIGLNGMLRTESLLVRPSSIIEWTIESVLGQSSVTVQ
jgi:hypothetical protein